MRPVQYGCVQAGQVALTFDGGPKSAALLDALQTQQWPAAYFVDATTGLSTPADLALLSTAYQRGHVIGQLAPVNPVAMDNDTLIARLRQDAQLIRARIGQWPRFLRVRRPQDLDQRVYEISSKLGFVLVEWNVEALDCQPGASADAIAQAFRAQFQRFSAPPAGSGSFIASHQDKNAVWSTAATAVLSAIGTALRAYSYPPTPVTLPVCVNVSAAYRVDNWDYRCYDQLRYYCDANGNVLYPMGPNTAGASGDAVPSVLLPLAAVLGIVIVSL